ncbi:MAG TPA: hypothetical protein VFN23_18475, partial [Ktedonobacteraceae bacterium]|nr:hypothetical protein [Ktedonobacteraceae bacterium]
MTTAPLYHPGVFDEAARSYLLAVQRGEKPVRPDCGQHENLIVYVENCLKDVSNRVGIAPRLLDSMIASGKYPGLAELLSMPEQGERRALALVEQSANGCPALPIEVQLDPELAAGACWWLDDYAAYSLSASPEGYKDFHEDCGLFVLAAVSARRVHVPVGQGGEYTPLSVALVAKPGTYAKSTT